MTKPTKKEIEALNFALATAQTHITKERTNYGTYSHDTLDTMQTKLDVAKKAVAKLR